MIRIKNSSKSLFVRYMEMYSPDLETCPVCSSRGNCHIHAYYGRSITDFVSGHPRNENLCVLRVECASCGHTHAILPDFIVPYTGYSLFFILRALSEYFAGLYTLEAVCERFGISNATFHKWLALWKHHKSLWLGYLSNAETSDQAFLRKLILGSTYSAFSMDFIRLTTHNFLQSHRNPAIGPPGSETAHYCQKVFEPDIRIF